MKKIRRMVGAASVVMSVAAVFGLAACSGDEEPQAEADASRDGAADGPRSDASFDASRADARLDAASFQALCRSAGGAGTAPSCAQTCICDQCSNIAFACYNSPDCAAIIDCVASSGCVTQAACQLQENCGQVLLAHPAGLIASLAVANCYTSSCSAQCGAVDGGAAPPRDAGPDARREAATAADADARLDGDVNDARDSGAAVGDSAADGRDSAATAVEAASESGPDATGTPPEAGTEAGEAGIDAETPSFSDGALDAEPLDGAGEGG
jgi:hypothetical protein